MTFEELMNAYHINDDLCNKVVYNSLLKELKNNRIIPVIGAGLSMWTGYPSWGSFILKSDGCNRLFVLLCEGAEEAFIKQP